MAYCDSRCIRLLILLGDLLSRPRVVEGTPLDVLNVSGFCISKLSDDGTYEGMRSWGGSSRIPIPFYFGAIGVRRA